MSFFPDVCAESLVTVDDATTGEIVGRELYDDAVFRQNLDVMLTHFARDVGEHDVPVFQLDTEHCIGQGFRNGALDLNNAFLFSHDPR